MVKAVQSSQTLHTISTISANTVVTVNLAGNDTNVQMMFGAFFLVWALAQRTRVDLIGGGSIVILANTEQSAGFFPLTFDFL